MLGFQGGVSIPLVKGGVKAPPAKRQCRAGPKAGARRGFTYAPSDCLEGLGVFVGISPCLLSTLLHIPFRLSRVPYRGLKQDDVGGALSTVPSALCGSPDGAWGKNRFAHALFHRAYGITQCRAYCCRQTVSVGLAGIIGKVCQGHSSPKDDMRFM